MKLLNFHEVGELINLNESDVRRLVRDGKLQAISQIVRGTGTRPRKFVLDSEVERYIKSLIPVIKPLPVRVIRRQLHGVTEYY